MKFRRTPNPNRNHPLHCPYCASEELFPAEESDFAWSCVACLRVFEVRFFGQDAPESQPEPALSTSEAIARSLAKART